MELDVHILENITSSGQFRQNVKILVTKILLTKIGD